MMVFWVWPSAPSTLVSKAYISWVDLPADRYAVQPKAQTTFFDTVKSQLDSPLFAVQLKHDAPGVYDFGYIDDSKYTGSITYTDADSSQGYWGFSTDGYSIGDGSSSSSGFSAIAGKSPFQILLLSLY